MMQTEYVRNLQNNYERILLEEEPGEQRYQYCILSRGGIKGLLPFGLRRINEQVYLYYDITSKQCVGHLFSEKPITREWLKDFMWSLKQIGQELDRFLLNDSNILWFPDQIYQDLEKNLFYFLYIPYWERENGFKNLLEFLVEHVDYEDEALVELVYKMYESYEKNQDAYLREQIYEDFRVFSENKIDVDQNIAGESDVKTESYSTTYEEKEAEKEPEVELVPMSETDISADAGVEFLKDILREMEIEADVKTAFNPVDDTVSFEIVGTGMGLLIGKRGKTLDALQYLLSLVMNKGSERYIRVKLDTEDYRRRRKETLETLARNMASKARKTRRNVELEPMNAYERRIIHYSLQNNRYVTTHSEGEDPYRHVVIVPNQATGSSRHYN